MNLKGILEVVGRSDTGQVRDHNEDYIVDVAEIGLVVLADGMGGYKGGEVASAIAVNTIVEELKAKIPGLQPGESDKETGYTQESIAARRSIIKANEIIYKTSRSQAQYQGMGTTVVLGMFYDNRLTVAHVGDSRMYRYRDHKLEQITVDHTLLQELVDRGFYSAEEAQESLNRNLVTRALGIETTVAVDIHEEMALPGDIYLLCSDGLNDMVGDEAIASIFRAQGEDLERLADGLIKAANEGGGKDNISVLLACPSKAFPAKRQWHQRFVSWRS
jgi:serine/threonine protein phosphatase PrpC